MGLGVQLGSMGFVTATAPGEAVVEKEVKGTGGEFGRLLERLNRASASASASAASSVDGAANEEVVVVAPEKKSKKEGKKRKRDKEEEEGQVEVTPVPVVEEVAPPSPAVLHNLRNA